MGSFSKINNIEIGKINPSLLKIKLSRYSLEEILEFADKNNVSDIFLADLEPVRFKIVGLFYETEKKLPEKTIEKFFHFELEKQRRKLFKSNNQNNEIFQCDFRIDFSDSIYFRVNYYRSKGHSRAVLRVLKKKSYTLSELGVHPKYEEILNCPEGLIIVSGPTGSGKTTTLSAILNELTKIRKGHYLTMEDPIEIFIEPKEGIIVSQRELGYDLNSFYEGLKSAMRQAPDVILVGEIRDSETLQLTAQLASTGHLVFSTFHANNCLETLIRMLSMIPEDHEFTRINVIFSLKYVLSQRLIRTVDGKRAVICEMLPIKTEIRSLLMKKKFAELRSLYSSYGGITFYHHLKMIKTKYDFRREEIEFIKKISSVSPI